MSVSKVNIDSDNLVVTDKNGDISGFRVKDFQYTSLGMFIIYRLLHDRDLKIVITSKGSTTGTGKTTLAIILARLITKFSNDIFNRNKSWSAEEYAFMDVYEYLNKYANGDSGDVLITDELEYLADRRRSMSNKNVFFSQAWSMLRYKNCITIGTAPSLWDLDKRVPENTDIWINVVFQGRANTYHLSVNDFTGYPERTRFKNRGYRESLLWGDLENDKDYEFLKTTKSDIGIPGMQEQEEQLTEQDLKETKREIRTKIAVKLLEESDEWGMSQADIAETVGYSQPNIAKIKREYIDSNN